MMEERFIRVVDIDLDEPLTLEAVADAIGTQPALISRLVRMGLLDTVCDQHQTLLPSSAILRLRRMQRLRRDLRVNFTGAAIILDLVERIRELNRALAEAHGQFENG